MCKKNHILVKTTGKKTGEVTMYCLVCEAQKAELQKIIDAKLQFTKVEKL